MAKVKFINLLLVAVDLMINSISFAIVSLVSRLVASWIVSIHSKFIRMEAESNTSTPSAPILPPCFTSQKDSISLHSIMLSWPEEKRF